MVIRKIYILLIIWMMFLTANLLTVEQNHNMFYKESGKENGLLLHENIELRDFSKGEQPVEQSVEQIIEQPPEKVPEATKKKWSKSNNFKTSTSYDRVERKMFETKELKLGVKSKWNPKTTYSLNFNYNKGDAKEEYNDVSLFNIATYKSLGLSFTRELSSRAKLTIEQILSLKTTDSKSLFTWEWDSADERSSNSIIKYDYMLKPNLFITPTVKYYKKNSKVKDKSRRDRTMGFSLWYQPTWKTTFTLDSYYIKKIFPYKPKWQLNLADGALNPANKVEQQDVYYFRLNMDRYLSSKLFSNLYMEYVPASIDQNYNSDLDTIQEHYWDMIWASVSGYLTYTLNNKNSLMLWFMDSLEKYKNRPAYDANWIPKDEKEKTESFYLDFKFQRTLSKNLEGAIGYTFFKWDDEDTRWGVISYNDDIYYTELSLKF